jgi:hypothetical protein
LFERRRESRRVDSRDRESRTRERYLRRPRVDGRAEGSKRARTIESIAKITFFRLI